MCHGFLGHFLALLSLLLHQFLRYQPKTCKEYNSVISQPIQMIFGSKNLENSWLQAKYKGYTENPRVSRAIP